MKQYGNVTCYGSSQITYYDSSRNQALIQVSTGVTLFRSYDTIIAKKEDGKICLDDKSWDFSLTTGIYRNKFLAETKKVTLSKIKSGEYKLCSLN